VEALYEWIGEELGSPWLLGSFPSLVLLPDHRRSMPSSPQTSFACCAGSRRRRRSRSRSRRRSLLSDAKWYRYWFLHPCNAQVFGPGLRKKIYLYVNFN